MYFGVWITLPTNENSNLHVSVGTSSILLPIPIVSCVDINMIPLIAPMVKINDMISMSTLESVKVTK